MLRPPMPNDGFVFSVGVLAGLGSAGGWALGSHLFGRALGRHPTLAPEAANLFKNSLTLLVFASVWGLAGWQLAPDSSMIWLLASGLFGFALGDALYFAALPLCGVQLAALTGTSIPPLAALLGWLMGKPAPSGATFGFMGLVLVGLAIVVTDSRSKTVVGQAEAGARRRGFLLASLAALAQAFAIASGSYGFGSVEPTPAGVLPGTCLRLVGGVLGALVIAVMASARHRGALTRLTLPLRRSGLAPALLIPTFVATILNLPLHSYALADLPPGTSAILFATTPLFTLPIGIALGARYGWQTWVGTLLAFAGVAGVIRFGT